MNTPKLILSASLVANLALAAILLTGSMGRDGTEQPSASTPAAAVSASTSGASAGATEPDSDTWVKLQTLNDLPGMMKRLESEGFPPAIVRALMAEQVRAKYAPKRVALDRHLHEVPFWMNGSYGPRVDAAVSETVRDQQKETRELLGTEANVAYADRIRQQLPGFPADKLDALVKIQMEASEAQTALLGNISGQISTATSESLRAIQRESMEKIRQALTPEEFEDYQLRMSTTANMMRSRLVAFDTNEAEFRALFKAQEAYDNRLSAMPSISSPELARQRREMQEQLNTDIRTTLGEQRYAEYERAIDGRYQQLNRIVSRLEMPPATAVQAYAVLQAHQQRLQAMNSNRDLRPEERTAQMSALTAQHEQEMAGVLGARGLEAFKLNGGSGQFIQTSVGGTIIMRSL